MGGSSLVNAVCTHCGSTKSPLWRRGIRSEILCNACGLYWKHHGTYRPMPLKGAGERRETIPRVKTPVGEPLSVKRESSLRRLKSALEASTASTDGIVFQRRKVEWNHYFCND